MFWTEDLVAELAGEGVAYHGLGVSTANRTYLVGFLIAWLRLRLSPKWGSSALPALEASSDRREGSEGGIGGRP